MSQGFKNTQDFQDACHRIIIHPKCNDETKEFVSGVADTTSESGYVTATQARAVGGCYKYIINNGQFIKHDWWD